MEVRSRWLTEHEGNKRDRNMFFGAVHIRDVDFGWRLLPDYNAYTKETTNAEPYLFMSTNNEGFRALRNEKEIPETGKVMVLGDSFAEGLFLSQQETIPAVISRRLGGYVYNFGVTGYSTDQEYTVFTKWIDKINVEAVALLFCYNDILDIGASNPPRPPKPYYGAREGIVDFSKFYPLSAKRVEEENAIIDSTMDHEGMFCCFTPSPASLPDRVIKTTRRYLANLYHPGMLLSVISSDIARTKFRFSGQYMKVAAPLLENPEAHMEKIDLVFQFFVKMREESDKRGIKFVVFYVPDILQTYSDGKTELQNLRKVFMEKCVKNGITCLDPSDELAEKAKWNDTYFMDDGHFSPFGAELAGAMISNAIAGK
ncbi:MAG: hypothetical protein OEZ04_10650 [Nitrospinota bacterium]|nr:hypothetical protein [Nitrospinota bacterium]